MLWQNYHRPASVAEALKILSGAGRTRLVAGATDLGVQLKRGELQIDALVDVTKIPHLDYLREQDGFVKIGALVTHAQAAESRWLKEKAPLLAQACSLVGSPQIRNLGTLGGNIVSASPANDSIAPLMALGAHVSVSGARGRERVVPLDRLVVGVGRTTLEADEMLTEIAFPALQENERGTFIKLGLRRAQAIAIVSVALLVTFAGDGAAPLSVMRARIALGSVAPTVVLADQAQEYLVGKTLSETAIAEAGRLAVQAISPISDLRASADYRREMVRVLVARALRQLRDLPVGAAND